MAKCFDCGKPYGQQGMDTVLTESLWAQVFPEEYGLLCVDCIRARLRKIGETAMFCVSEKDFKKLRRQKIGSLSR